MIAVGQVLNSYCQGYFGRDFFGGRVEAVGWDWIVARSRRGYPAIAYLEGGIAAHADEIAKWNEYEKEWDDDAA